MALRGGPNLCKQGANVFNDDHHHHTRSSSTMMMPVLYRRFRITKHANFLLAFAFYQREASTTLLFARVKNKRLDINLFSFFLSFFFSSLDTTSSRSDEEELANDNAHTGCANIFTYSRTHTHRVWKVSGERG